MVFCRANAREVNRLSAIFEVCTKVLGQKINLAKSVLFCSKNTHPAVVEELCNILHVKKLSLDSKYLGLPLFIGRSKKKAFRDVKEKVLSKIAGWKMRALSQVGRTTLIKAVATAMPLYCMSTFLLPRGWCEDIDSMLKNFWWGLLGAEKPQFYSKGLEFYLPSEGGGRHWDLNNPEKLWASIAKAKYRIESPLISPSSHGKFSVVWKGILKVVPLLKTGCCLWP